MIRDRIGGFLRRLRGGRPKSSDAPASPLSDPPPSPKAESEEDKPWYLDGSSETWGWEKTNAKDPEAGNEEGS